MPGGPPGAIVVVQRGSDRSVHAAGVAEVGSDAAPDIDDHMRLASVAKAFNGAAALSLVDEGVMSLDDTIGERLPDLPDAWGEVTLRQLLSHTSGLPDYSGTEAFGAAVTNSPGEAPPPAELLAFVEDEPLVFPPGSRYAYSNSDNITVGLMIEAVTGREYADVLAQKVFGPLGLDDTSLPTGTELPDPLFHGYGSMTTARRRTRATSSPPDICGRRAGWCPHPPTSTTSSAATSAASCSATRCAPSNRTCSFPAVDPNPPGRATNSASMALFRYETECGAVYGHTGNFFGYTQFAVASPDGQRSATASISLKSTQHDKGQAASVFTALQRLEQAAICYALE